MRHLIPFVAVATTAMALPAAPALAQAMTAKTFVMKAGAGDLYEKQSSQLILSSTTNPQLKQFAQKMITDHTKSTADVKAAAMAAHMHPAPPMLDPMGRANMAKLRAAHGAARDAMYVSQQKTAHQMALQLHQNYAANGRVTSLKNAAAKIAPVVQGHIDMLDGMGTMSAM